MVVDFHRAAVWNISGGRGCSSIFRMAHPAARCRGFLQQNGVIRSAIAFEIYARRHPTRRLQAGEYFFSQPISGHDVFWQIADGHIYEQPFTVREGETMFDIARDLEAGKFMAASDFLTAAKNPELVHDLAPNAKTLEGFLYPATYNLPRRPAANELTAEMVKKFKEEWSRIRSDRADRSGQRAYRTSGHAGFAGGTRNPKA